MGDRLNNDLQCNTCGAVFPLDAVHECARMTDLPDAVVEAAARSLLDLWGWAGIDHPDTSEARSAWERADNYARAALATASGPWAEQLDAANAELRRDLNNEASALQETETDLAAALARNAELEREVGQWKDRMWVSVRERAVWSHEAGEHAGDVPFMHCPMCESKTLRAELDNLRASLTKRTHDWLAHCKRLDAEREAITDDLGKAWKELGEIESGASEDE